MQFGIINLAYIIIIIIFKRIIVHSYVNGGEKKRKGECLHNFLKKCITQSSQLQKYLVKKINVVLVLLCLYFSGL